MLCYLCVPDLEDAVPSREIPLCNIGISHSASKAQDKGDTSDNAL